MNAKIIPFHTQNNQKTRKRNYDSERARVSFVYAKLFLEEHAPDQEELKKFFESYSKFPKTASEVFEETLQAFPNNIFCRAKDKLRISSIITNTFSARTDVTLSNPNRKGGTYVLTPSFKKAVPVKKQKEQSDSGFATKNDLNRVESKIDSLIEKLSK